METSLERLNDHQYEALKQFKNNISDVLPSDFPDVRLLKFLRAHNYNLKKTEFVFRGAMRYRTLYGMHSKLESYIMPEVLGKYECSSSLGRAKDGTPIRYTHFGAGDLVGMLMSLSVFEIGIYCNYLVEYDIALMKKYSKEVGKEVSGITYIVDMDGFSLGQIMHKSTIETAIDLIQIMQDLFPEIWENILIVNAPSYFDIAFNTIKPILRLTMLQKIRMASRDMTPSLLLKYIDEDVLPSFLGGKRTDSSGNPRCTEFVKFGGKIPEEYYLRHKASLRLSDPGVTSQWISARCVFNYSAVVREPHSKIRLEFRTENGSIGLKIQYREFGSNSDVPDLPPCDEYLDDNKPACNVIYISPCCRMQSHFSPVDQTINAPWPGIYIIRFDNTYGWFTSRRLFFRIQVV